MQFSPRVWATVSLVAAGLWLLFSLAPTPATTLIGLPFLAAALAAGGWGRRNGQRAGDTSAVRRATWGLGLSCAGCVWQVIVLTVFGSLSAALLAELLRYLQDTPTP